MNYGFAAQFQCQFIIFQATKKGDERDSDWSVRGKDGEFK